MNDVGTTGSAVRRRALWRVLAGVLLVTLALPVLAAEGVPVRVGLLGYRGEDHAVGTWDATLRHLDRALPGHVFTGTAYDLPGLHAAVAAGQVDFIITNPGHYVELEAAYGVTRIATVETPDGVEPSAAIGSALIVRAGRADLQDLGDLKGARLGAVHPEAFGGFRVAWREFAAAGIDPFSDLTPHFYGFPMEAVVEAVAAGAVDVGIIRACMFEYLAAEGMLRREEFRILGGRPMTGPASIGRECQTSTRLYPDWPFAKLAGTPDALAKQVGMALLAMPVEGGHAWTVPVDYQPVHDLFRDLMIGPYGAMAERPLPQILRDIWPWLALAALALAWWVVHVARVEVLVRRRTKELRDAHAEARRQRGEKEHAARLALLGEMASSMAHEINQPLAAIANYASGCERRIAAGTDLAGVAEGVHLIAGQAERAAAIVKRVRTFVGKQASEVAPLDLNVAACSALDLFRDAGASRDIQLPVALAGDLPMVRGDRLQIELVLLNLLQNAADATAGQAQRTVSVTSGRAPDGGVEVRVADNGPGLQPDIRARLFEPFFTTKPQGMGLGLSLSRSIIESHGGRLWVEGGPTGGACFCFTLPVEGPR
ncbi:MAG: PhnD/SsuA/transferrin family substrate-binding protein [Rhodospirillaceae bacterium]